MTKETILLSPQDNLLRLHVQSLENELAARGLSLAVADCAGGDLIDTLTIPGSTRVLHVSGMFASLESKLSFGVPHTLIEKFGECSQETALALARNMQCFRRDNIVIATNGIFTKNNLFAHIVFVMYGKPSWSETVSIQDSRKEAKRLLTAKVLARALLYIRGHAINEKFELHPLVSTEEISLDTHIEIESKYLIKQAQKFGFSIETIESCTGGAIGNSLTDIPESDNVRIQTWLAYDENVKAQLGVPLADMAFGNVYSQAVARSMATARYLNAHADIVIATTGLMDTLDTRPFHNHTKPGTIHIGIIVEGEIFSETLQLVSASREKMKKMATHHILKRVNEKLNEWSRKSYSTNVQKYE